MNRPFTSPALEGKRRVLEQRLASPKCRRAAFIDESYTAPKDDRGKTFYIIAAFVTEKDELKGLAQDLETKFAWEHSGGLFWHSTDAHGGGRDMQARLEGFCDYLGEGPSHEALMAVVVAPILRDDSDGEQARRRCLKTALQLLHDGVEGVSPADLVVLEERAGRANVDQRTVTEAVREGLIDRNYPVLPTTPSLDSARGLWCADVVAYSVARELSSGDNRYSSRLGDQLRRFQAKSNPRVP